MGELPHAAALGERPRSLEITLRVQELAGPGFVSENHLQGSAVPQNLGMLREGVQRELSEPAALRGARSILVLPGEHSLSSSVRREVMLLLPRQWLCWKPPKSLQA